MNKVIVHLDNAEPSEVERVTQALAGADVGAGDIVTVDGKEYRITRIDSRVQRQDAA
jgi:uncharacterized Zn finger protein